MAIGPGLREDKKRFRITYTPALKRYSLQMRRSIFGWKTVEIFDTGGYARAFIERRSVEILEERANKIKENENLLKRKMEIIKEFD